MSNDDRLEPIRVAIVDDDASVSAALVRLCLVVGFEATAFASGPEFLAALESGTRVDCLVLDSHMPDMTGPELQRHLRAQRVEFPTIVLTADHSEQMFEGLTDGRVIYLHKPVETDALIEAIESITESVPPEIEGT